MDGVKLHIGAQTRELRFGFDQVERAEALCGGIDIQTIVLERRSSLNMFRVAAAGFSEFLPGGKGKKVTPLDVKAWCKEEPAKYEQLCAAVDYAVALHLVDTKRLTEEQAKLLGEVLASVVNGGAGTKGSASPAATGSPSTSSEG